EYAHLLSKIRGKTAVVSPFTLLALPSSAQDQLECATLFAAKNLPAPDNIVWRIPKHDHERIRLAYLSADFHQHVYNAHTTASDSLWAGVPVLSQIGETFAGRVAASLLNAIGLRELVVPTAQAYEEACNRACE